MRTVTIANVGAVERLDIPLRPGLVVLRGVNGSGKSTALRAVTALASGDGAALEVRDGVDAETRGVVEGVGAKLTVGRRREHATADPDGRNRATGALEVRTLQGVNPLEFVSPGIVDPVRADAKRVAILCDLAGIAPSFDLFAEALGKGACTLATRKTREAGSLPEMAADLKRDLQAAALEVEQDAATIGGQIQAHLSASAGYDPDAQATEYDYDAELANAIRRHDGLRAQAESAARAAVVANAARTNLATLRATYGSASVDACTAECKAAGDDLARLRDAVRTAEARLNAATAALDKATTFAASVAAYERDIAAAEQAVAVDPADVAKAAQAVDTARDAKDRATLLAEKRRRREEADALLPKRDTLTAEAANLRALATKCEAVVSQAISRVAPAGLRVQDQRLVLDTKRGPTLVSDLSWGECVTLGVSIAAKSLGKDALLVVPQEALEGLDSAHYAELDNAAKASGVCILSAMADDGALRVEGGA